MPLKRRIQTPIFQFILIYLIFACAAAMMAVLVYRFTLKEKYTKIKINEKAYITGQIYLLSNVIDEIATDLLFLSDQEELHTFWETGSPEEKLKIAGTFRSLCLRSQRYDQIRLIDASGKETIRVNFANQKATIVQEHLLQDKSDRYYFKNAMRHDKGQIYISPMDLNIEQCEIEKPFKPVVRFCLPVFDPHGVRRGVLIINFLGNFLFQVLEQASTMSAGKLMILNGQGYWMYSTNQEDTWGFMLKERVDRTFQKRYPGLWSKICREGLHQVQNEKGIFTCSTIFPEKLPATGQGHPDEHLIAWKIISHVTAETISASLAGFRRQLIVYTAGVMAVLILPVFMYVQLANKRRALQEELIHAAKYDVLTGLPNRAMFFGVLDQVLRHAKRYRENFALLFIDIDGFKMVNDTLGHDVGDQLLVGIAQRFKDSIRESDIVARLGGDEFIILLNKINTPGEAEAIAAKLIEIISKPFSFSSTPEHPKTAVVGASIGISTYPTNGATPDLLVKKADQEMYRCKRQGKNRYSLSTSGAIDTL